MKKIFITGVAGVLGSGLARRFSEYGYYVEGCDVVRPEEAWRLYGASRVRYNWKSTDDLAREDIEDFDLIFDCGIGVPERALGGYSPNYALKENILPLVNLLEQVRNMEEKPTVVYPSSFNAMYGLSGGVFSEDTPAIPSGVYGWTKGACENLCHAYRISYDVPIIITRVGSSYGETMRTDELIARVILYMLKGKPFDKLYSPYAKRLWTYKEDTMRFYDKLVHNYEDLVGETLICAGNRSDEILYNYDVCNRIKELTGSSSPIILQDSYEPGEVVGGKTISFSLNATKTRELLGWSPKYSVDEGLKRTINWFKENLWRYE